jgi:hypothetical protein
MAEPDVVADADEESGRLHPVDDDDVLAVPDGQADRLADVLHEGPHAGKRQASHLQPAAGTCAQLDERDAEVVPPGVAVPDDESPVGQRFEETVEHGAVKAGGGRQLGDRAAVGR